MVNLWNKAKLNQMREYSAWTEENHGQGSRDMII